MPLKKQKAETVEFATKKMRYMCTPEMVQKVKDLLAMGNNATKICDELGIHRRTYYVWREKNPQFHQAIFDGVEVFWAIMGMKLVELAQEGMCKVEMAAEFGVNLSAFNHWISDEEKLKHYWDIAYTQTFAWWWKKVRTMLDDPKANKGGVALLIWCMKIRFKLFDSIVMSQLEDTFGITDDDKVVVEAELRLKKKWLSEGKKGQEDDASIIDIGEEGNSGRSLLPNPG